MQFFIFHQTLPDPHSGRRACFGLLNREIVTVIFKWVEIPAIFNDYSVFLQGFPHHPRRPSLRDPAPEILQSSTKHHATLWPTPINPSPRPIQFQRPPLQNPAKSIKTRRICSRRSHRIWWAAVLDSCSGRRSLLGICPGQWLSGRWLTKICSNRRAKRASLIYLLLNFVRRFPLDIFLAGKFELLNSFENWIFWKISRKIERKNITKFFFSHFLLNIQFPVFWKNRLLIRWIPMKFSWFLQNTGDFCTVLELGIFFCFSGFCNSRLTELSKWQVNESVGFCKTLGICKFSFVFIFLRIFFFFFLNKIVFYLIIIIRELEGKILRKITKVLGNLNGPFCFFIQICDWWFFAGLLGGFFEARGNGYWVVENFDNFPLGLKTKWPFLV